MVEYEWADRVVGHRQREDLFLLLFMCMLGFMVDALSGSSTVGIYPFTFLSSITQVMFPGMEGPFGPLEARAMARAARGVK